jgi:hypothetical protein
MEGMAHVRAVHLKTCLRDLWITSACELSEHSVRALEGREAYRLLLEVGCGLQSAILGETDVFGQLKESWKTFESEKSSLARELHPWIQRIFEDIKEVRANHLQGLGGQSYGTLVRQMIAARPGESVFVVGAGALAKSILPYLSEHELWITNRTASHLQDFCGELLQSHHLEVKPFQPDESAKAWMQGDHILLCVPPDRASDLQRISWLNARAHAPRSLIHLGTSADEADAFAGYPGMKFLDDVFALQKEQSEARSLQLGRARKACDDRSQLRNLGGVSMTLPHGWEDLALFA